MSTRCQVVMKDSFGDSLWFYRHSDGYPEGALPTLEKFMTWVKDGRIRNNVEQSGGWLILIGAMEYNYHMSFEGGKATKRDKTIEELFNPIDWKVGAYEPCPCRKEHADIEYRYDLDLGNLTIKVTPKYDDETPYYVDGWRPTLKAGGAE